jgi:hypothetical protein
MRRSKRNRVKKLFLSRWLVLGICFMCSLILIKQIGIITQGISQKKGYPSDRVVPSINSDKLKTQQDYIDKAVEDLSAKLSVSKNKVTLMKVVDRDFNDTSIGCPKKGKIYAQVITPGFQIVLQVDGVNYIYNAGLNIVIMC